MAVIVQSPLSPEFASLLPEKARTFAFAARFLPVEQREATVVLYAFCRLMDDLADEPQPDLTRAEIVEQFAAWRDWLTAGQSAFSPSLPRPVGLAEALGEVVARHRLPTSYLLQLLDGLESDLGPVRMPSFAALQRYCYLVAGTVGLSMCHLLGSRRAEALAAAAELGVAMQLTNILRDLGADLRRDRVYLPADELAQFGYTPQRLLALAQADRRPDAQLRQLLQLQIERARCYYARGLAGVWLLPPEARPAILIAGRLYRAILNRIESSGYDVLRRRASTSTFAKGYEALVALVLVRLWGANWGTDELAPRLGRVLEVASWRES
jgi:phytoene synthase